MQSTTITTSPHSPQRQRSGILLYVLTIVLEIPVIALRFVLQFFFIEIPLFILGHPLPVPFWFLIALGPTLWSIFALFNPVGGGWWWRQNAGGRDPSQREQNAYEDAIEYLQAHRPPHLGPLPLPRSWFVVDEDTPDAGVVGDSLMLSRGLLQTALLAVLPHELNHIGTLDGRMTLALNRLVIHQAPRPRRDPENAAKKTGVVDVVGNFQVSTKTNNILTGLALFTFLFRKTLRFARGGLALKLTGPLWGRYWREREYAADHYAAQLGQADELADFLETDALIYDHPIPHIWLTDTDHDFTELRIDKLRNYTHEHLLNPAQPPTA